jgi:hypothetical protein
VEQVGDVVDDGPVVATAVGASAATAGEQTEGRGLGHLLDLIGVLLDLAADPAAVPRSEQDDEAHHDEGDDHSDAERGEADNQVSVGHQSHDQRDHHVGEGQNNASDTSDERPRETAGETAEQATNLQIASVFHCMPLSGTNAVRAYASVQLPEKRLQLLSNT